MSEMAARFRIQLEGQNDFLRFLDQANSGSKNLERNFSSSLGAIGRGLKQTGEDLAKLGVSAAKTAYSVSGLSLGISAQARGVLEFRDSVTKLATAASLAESDIGNLRNQILDVSAASGQMKEKVTDALGAFVAKTGDIETARKNLELYAKTATGTGAQLSEVALIGAELSKKFHISDQRTGLAVLAKQGDIGAIEFKDLASQGPRIFAAAASAGLKGEEGVRKIGGLAQLFAEGVGGSGSAARVATSIEGLLRDVSRKKGQGLLKKMGIEVGDRDAIDITEDVIRKFNGDDRAIQKTGLYTAASFRGVQTMSRAFRESGGKGFGQLDTFTNVAADDRVIDEKFARNSKSGLAALNRTQARADRAFDKNLGDTVENLARGSGGLAGAYEFATEHPGLVVGGGIGAMIAKNIIKNRGGGGIGGAIGNIVGSGTGQRVFVTNWPGALGGGPGAGTVTDALAKTAGPTSLVAAVGAPMAMVLGGLGLVAMHDKALEVGLPAQTKFSNDLQGDLAAGRKRSRRNWMGGTSYDVITDPAEQAKAAADYAKANPQVNLTVNVDKSGEVTLEETGTRAPVATMRRGGK